MALEELQAQISLLVSQINNQPEDVHELYELLHQKLNELRSTGQPLPQDLIDLEKTHAERISEAKEIIYLTSSQLRLAAEAAMPWMIFSIFNPSAKFT